MSRTDKQLFTSTQIPVCLGFLAKTKVPNASAQSPAMSCGNNALVTLRGGIFVQLEQFVGFDNGRLGNIAVCGLANTTTRSLATLREALLPKLRGGASSMAEMEKEVVT